MPIFQLRRFATSEPVLYTIQTMAKKFFIVPGFKQQATDEAYSWLHEFVQSQGWESVSVPIKWNYRVLSKNAAEFVDFYNKHKSEKNHVLGFSYGAVIAFVTSSSIKPDRQYLCSLSPDFIEDRPNMPIDIQHYIGKRRYNDISTRNAKGIAKHVDTPTTVFYGGQEAKLFPQLKNRAKSTAKDLGAKLIEIKNAPHQINHPEYKKAILDNLAL